MTSPNQPGTSNAARSADGARQEERDVIESLSVSGADVRRALGALEREGLVRRAEREPRRIIVASEAARLGRRHLDALEQHGFALIDRYDLILSTDEDEFSRALSGAWGLIAGGQKIPGRVIERSSSLRVIARTGAGYNGIDLRAAKTHGVAVFVTPSQNADGVADLTVALMLSTVRQIVKLDAMARSGHWRDGLTPTADLHRATVGIIGLGHIGRAVARRLTGFECRLLASEPLPDYQFCEQLGIQTLSLREMLPQVDILSIHIPLSDTTYHLIGEEELSLLQPHTFLINTSRGGIVDEVALLQALEKGRLGGAGIDVFEHEPLGRDHPFTRLPNVVLTPHVAAYSIGALSRVMGSVVEGLLEVSAGRTPVGSLNERRELAGGPASEPAL
jgi:D-3-phosphoglycerate dehydrogenase